MSVHERAGRPAPASMHLDIDRLTAAYFDRTPDPDNPAQRVGFGTSGHRGTSHDGSFNEAHILAITQAICEYRAQQGTTGPLFLGMDTHALSGVAHRTAIEVLAAHDVPVILAGEAVYTPTPVVSHAILTYNQSHAGAPADGIIITPSHNPPEDGGFKYNPPTGGPADTDATQVIQDRANALLADGPGAIRRLPYERALKADTIHRYDYVTPYVTDLAEAVDLTAVAASGLRIGVDPMGGAGAPYWAPLAERYGLQIEIVNPVIDPRFGFMTLDWDGKIRMDCSSPYAMASLVALRDRFDIAFGNDPDADRHGIVTPSGGLMNPNHYLSVAVWYLFQNRPGWPEAAGIGKTLVSSSMIDRVAAHLGRRLVEVPVGFKWFVDGLFEGTFGFGGEESAGASFLRTNGRVWTTDKDGILLNLLAAEITARTGRDPAEHYAGLEARFGRPVYQRVDAPATTAQKQALKALHADRVRADTLAGEPVQAVLTHAPGNGAPIGGLKVVTENGWFAARPSGTEAVYKIYAESFKGEAHLHAIQQEARRLVDDAFSVESA